jgi:hypothetical protein
MLVRMGVGKLAAMLVLLAGMPRIAGAEELGEDDVERRLHFLESRLKAEATQARWYEAGWSLVYVGGLGYGAYQIAQAETNGALAEGIVGASKSVIGAAGLALQPLKAARGTRELDEGADAAAAPRDQRLALAESLLRRNAREADIRYAWQPHVISLVLNLVGGAIIWIAGDLSRAAQSTGIALAVGELSIWTRPWGAKRDLREYKRDFGGLAFEKPARTPTVVTGPSVRLTASGAQLIF